MEFLKFYDALSSDYDSMTEFTARLTREESFFRKIVQDNSLNTALDVGCGTGLHSFLLANLGLEVTGIDPSKKMIELARNNIEKIGKEIKFIDSDLNEFNKSGKHNFESVFCMGNTLPHLLSLKKLEQAFAQFYRIMQKNGLLVTQTLNYDKICKEKERIVNIKEIGNKTFIRFYDFMGDLLKFNILIVSKEDSKLSHALISTDLYPYKILELISVSKMKGFTLLGMYGDMNFNKYDQKKSPNIILVFKK